MLTPEQLAHHRIEVMLKKVGWHFQHYCHFNHAAAMAVAVDEHTTGISPAADNPLVDRIPISDIISTSSTDRSGGIGKLLPLQNYQFGAIYELVQTFNNTIPKPLMQKATVAGTASIASNAAYHLLGIFTERLALSTGKPKEHLLLYNSQLQPYGK